MDAVEEIKSRLNIEDVASQYVELKRSGRNFKALSPFTNEKSASLMISPEKQIWHDFSSGKGGDMFSLVMELEGLDFKGSMEVLARQAGVDLDQFRGATDKNSGQKQRLLEALEKAATFYQTHLNKNTQALQYLRTKRGFSKQTIITFRLGYAPEGDDALTRFLLSRKFTPTELKKAGLSTQRYRGLGDMFRGRIMIPLMDGTGQVIGFTARLLADQPNAPKYINTPQTLVYDKSRHVFGLHAAKEAIRKQSYAVVVEGNMDVIASHQAKVTNVVATAGTALTESHLKTLSRFTSDIRLAFDQDKAGQNATERAIPLASTVGVSLGIISVKEGKDPDELVRKDPKLWEAAVTKPQYAIDWLIDRYKAQVDIDTAQGKRQLSDQVLATIKALSDPVEQDHYLLRLAELLAVSPDALRAKLRQATTAPARTLTKRKIADQSKTNPVNIDKTKAQNNLLCLALMHAELRAYLEPLEASMLIDNEAGRMLEVLKENPTMPYAKILALEHDGALRVREDYGKMLLLLYEELYHNLELTELRYEAARLQVRLVSIYVKEEKQKIAIALQSTDDQKTDHLLKEAKALDHLLRTTKENES